jgi:hypothetical protein
VALLLGLLGCLTGQTSAWGVNETCVPSPTTIWGFEVPELIDDYQSPQNATLGDFTRGKWTILVNIASY